ncbi:MAG: hypothetical protein JO305_09030 [Alphaproteobacteria bacterium]|nr:hypothetical protein [Alphaproteobacteria bacterium]
MRKISLFAMLAIMAFGTSGGRITHLYRTAFPSDLAEREALHRCSIADSKFSRFSERDRAACYQQNRATELVPVNGTRLPPGPEFNAGMR